ncbi:hypothetical protein PQR68_34465 [Paraburkholderia agricolaris]|uniref:hypothetical protein n=1 Tax=Paraburkholderia agricolaris TaxID=2152888 RepID=UPI0038BAD02B
MFKRIAIAVLIAASGFSLAACSSMTSSPPRARVQQNVMKDVTVALTRSCATLKGRSAVLQHEADDVEVICSSYSGNAELVSVKVQATHHPEAYLMTLRFTEPNLTVGSETVQFVNYLRSDGWSIEGDPAHFTAKQGGSTAEVRLTKVGDSLNLEIRAVPANQG